MADHVIFNGQIAIGLPENNIFMDRRGALNWASIWKCVKDKYDLLAPTCPIAKCFSELFEKFSAGERKRAVLIFPNCWPQFDLRTAYTLAQVFLAQTSLNVL